MGADVLIAAVVFAVGAVADALTTGIALRRGLAEGHPIVKLLGKRAPIFLGIVSAAVLAFALVAAYVAPAANARIAFWFLLGFGALRIGVAANNARLIGQKGTK